MFMRRGANLPVASLALGPAAQHHSPTRRRGLGGRARVETGPAGPRGQVAGARLSSTSFKRTVAGLKRDRQSAVGIFSHADALRRVPQPGEGYR
jgi:hypothetical protein